MQAVTVMEHVADEINEGNHPLTHNMNVRIPRPSETTSHGACVQPLLLVCVYVRTCYMNH
jgi:hypothetical protein